MTRRKTDGERIAARLFGLEIDDMESRWLATQIDRIIRRRMAEAWDKGWGSPKWQNMDENPYRKRNKK